MKRFLIVCITVAVAISCFTACGGAAPSSPAPSRAPAASQAPAAPAASASEHRADYEAYDVPSESAMPLPLLTPSNADGKKIIYTVRLWLQTTGFDAGTRKLLNTVSDMGGYLQSAYIDGRDLHYPDVERSATYTLRVPSERLAEFLVVMEDNFTLQRLEQESQDVTANRQQNDTRLDDLREQEKRLLDTIKSTTDADEKLRIERQLADVQASISSLDASQASMDNAIIYSTVTIVLSEIIFDEPEEEQVIPFSQKLSSTVNNTISGFVAFCQGFLLFMIAMLPVLLVLAVFVAIALLIRRVYRKVRNTFRVPDDRNMPEPEQYDDLETEFTQDDNMPPR